MPMPSLRILTAHDDHELRLKSPLTLPSGFEFSDTKPRTTEQLGCKSLYGYRKAL